MVVKKDHWGNLVYYKVLLVYPGGKELPPKKEEWRTGKRAEQQKKKEDKSFRLKMQVVFNTNKRDIELYEGTIVYTEIRELCNLQPVSGSEYKELLMRKFEEA